MFGLFKFRNSYTQKNHLAEKKKALEERILSHPLNQWISEDKYYTRAFQILIDSLNEEAISFFLKELPLAFINSNGTLGCTLSSEQKIHLIVVFPDLCRLLRSAVPTRGIAVLAHELGHIFLKHAKRNISAQQSQLEADTFVHLIGFGEDLRDVLKDYPYSEECRARIKHLTNLIKASNERQLTA